MGPTPYNLCRCGLCNPIPEVSNQIIVPDLIADAAVALSNNGIPAVSYLPKGLNQGATVQTGRWAPWPQY